MLLQGNDWYDASLNKYCDMIRYIKHSAMYHMPKNKQPGEPAVLAFANNVYPVKHDSTIVAI